MITAPQGKKHYRKNGDIRIRRRFRSGVTIYGTKMFPGSDKENKHDMVMITFRDRSKKAIKPIEQRLSFDLNIKKTSEVS